VPADCIDCIDRPANKCQPTSASRLYINEKLSEAVNATGKVFLSHTRLKDRFSLRFSLRVAIGNLRTTHEHIKTAWDLLRREAARLIREGS
jgi:aromatic-L-amino-acid decarboxylase